MNTRSIVIGLMFCAVACKAGGDRVDIPAADILKKRLGSGSSLWYFNQKTSLIGKLAGQSLEVSSIVTAINSAINDFGASQNSMSEDVIKHYTDLYKPGLLKVFLQDHPEALKQAQEMDLQLKKLDRDNE